MRRVVITGIGIVSPIGNNLEENKRGIYEGRCGIAPITYFDTEEYKVKMAGKLKNLDMTEYFSPKEIKRMDKFVALAIIAARQVVSNSGISEFDAWNSCPHCDRVRFEGKLQLCIRWF